MNQDYLTVQALLRRMIAYHPIFAQLMESAAGGAFLSQLYYWSTGDKAHDPDNFIYKTLDEWQREVCISRREWEVARKKLKNLGLLVERQKGLDRQIWYKLDLSNLYKKIIDLSLKPNNDANVRSDVTKSQILRYEESDVTFDLYTEITPKITSNIYPESGENFSNLPETSPLDTENESTYLNTREGTLQTLLEQNQRINDYPLEQHSISCEEKDLPAARVTKVAKPSQRDEQRARAGKNSLLQRGIENDRWSNLEQFKQFRVYVEQAASDRATGITAGQAGVVYDANWVEGVIVKTANCADDKSVFLQIWTAWQMEIPAPPLFIATDEPKSEAPTSEFLARFEATREANRLRKERAELDRFKYERADECVE